MADLSVVAVELSLGSFRMLKLNSALNIIPHIVFSRPLQKAGKYRKNCRVLFSFESAGYFG